MEIFRNFLPEDVAKPIKLNFWPGHFRCSFSIYHSQCIQSNFMKTIVAVARWLFVFVFFFPNSMWSHTNTMIQPPFSNASIYAMTLFSTITRNLFVQSGKNIQIIKKISNLRLKNLLKVGSVWIIENCWCHNDIKSFYVKSQKSREKKCSSRRNGVWQTLTPSFSSSTCNMYIYIQANIRTHAKRVSVVFARLSSIWFVLLPYLSLRLAYTIDFTAAMMILC